MTGSICLFVCDAVYPEIKFVVEDEGFENVRVVCLASNCFGPLLSKSRLKEYLNDDGIEFRTGLLFGDGCLTGNRDLLNDARIIPVELGQCHELFINPKLLQFLNQRGDYIVSNGWLQNLKHFSRQWGFSGDQAQRFFSESCRKIVMLDTGLTSDYLPSLESFSAYTGLRYEILPVGLDYCRLLIRHHITTQQKILDAESHNAQLARDMRRSADIMVAFREINEIVTDNEEARILRRLFHLIKMLCAPEDVRYYSADNEPTGATAGTDDSHIVKEEEQRSFSFTLRHDKVYGVVSVVNVMFPEFIGHYRDLALMISSVTGMAISNARKYDLLKKSEKTLAEHAEKLSSLNVNKDKFFSIISHDLRNPIATLLSLANILNESFSTLSNEEQSDIISRFTTLARQGHELIEDLLAWASLQQDGMKMNIRPFNIAAVITQVISLLQGNAGLKHIELKAGCTYTGEVLGDQTAIMTVIRNLVTNAVKFTRPEGKIEITTETSGSDVRVTVNDNGVGMSAEVLSRLFRIESGFSTRGTKDEKGTGLGLILCRELVERNNGTIGVESVQGQGSTFWFVIPAARERLNSQSVHPQ